MALDDRRIGFAGIPALGTALLVLGLCALAGADPEPWVWLALGAGGMWGYRYARRWSS
ncbi:hypothetical protein OG215_36715 (plasmid) [Streptomyces globisporus]|uniref:hypothetical protein n=1 Tax=Streptomyces globisporus TaxID=1908 RepID=UPI002F917A9E|nr:hypothetical protein OG215_36715 [Streptomyces globisporus]